MPVDPSVKPKPASPEKGNLAPPRTGYSRRQVTVGVIGTIVAHIWLYLLFSLGFFEAGPLNPAEDPYKEYTIELEAAEEPEEQVYTATNPDVPENEPDETNRFGARDQQAANEEMPEELDPDNLPATQSADDFETDQVLTGSLEEPIYTPPPAEQSQEQPTEQTQEQSQSPASPNQPLLQAVDENGQPQKEEIPLFGSEEEAEDESGIAEHVYDKVDETPTNVTELVEGEEEEGESEASSENSPEVPPSMAQRPSLQEIHTDQRVPAPRPRPQLPRVVTSPIRHSDLGVSNVGMVSADSRSSELGEYADRLFETISIRWNNLASTNAAKVEKSLVKVRFRLSSDGGVLDIEILEGTTSGVAGIYLCREAIQRASPFAPWPESIVQLFGNEKDVFLTFRYY